MYEKAIGKLKCGSMLLLVIFLFDHIAQNLEDRYIEFEFVTSVMRT
jgi:hypothetical protein